MRSPSNALPKRIAALVGCAAVFAAWGCAAPGRPRPLRPVAATDDAVELAALLPETADRCVVVRPGRVADRRRPLILYRSWARPQAWSREWRVAAYAEAVSREPRARRTYLRFAARTDALDAHLATLPLRWLDEPCEGAACRRPVARWLDERTLAVSLRPWPREPHAVPTAACVQLATAHPDAVEVAADGAGGVGRLARGIGAAPPWGPDPRPHRVHRLLFVDDARLRARRVLTFRDEPSAEAWEALRRTTGEVTPSLLPAEPTAATVSRRGNRISVEEDHRFEELELRLEDERLERRAYAHRRGRAEPVGVDDVDVANLAVVRHQVQLRQADVLQRRGRARQEAARALADLLARASEAHPARVELAEQLARLALDTLEEPARAAAVVERVLASGFAAEPARWRLLEREILSHLDAEALAGALADAGLAGDAEAATAARDLAALRRAGVRYEWAEGAWARGRELLAEADPAHAQPGDIDVVGALGALALWARARDPAAEGAAVHVAARWRGDVEARPMGRSRPELLVLRAGAGRGLAVGAVPRGDLASLRGLGASLAAVIEPGPFTLVLELATPRGALGRFALEGRRVGDRLEVTRVSDALRGVRWDALQRYLAEPIAALPTALFPPPELTVRAASAEEAAELRRATETVAPGACRVAGPYLRCTSPGRPERLAEILAAAARSRPLTR